MTACSQAACKGRYLPLALPRFPESVAWRPSFRSPAASAPVDRLIAPKHPDQAIELDVLFVGAPPSGGRDRARHAGSAKRLRLNIGVLEKAGALGERSLRALW
jgi:hypothetical protein